MSANDLSTWPLWKRLFCAAAFWSLLLGCIFMSRFLRVTALWVLLLPYAITFLGAASNQLVLNVNNDTFPVRLNGAKVQKFTAANAVTLPDGTVMLDDTHCLMTAKTHLNWLADIFDFHQDIQSIGDLFLEFGIWLQTWCPFVWVAIIVERLKR